MTADENTVSGQEQFRLINKGFDDYGGFDPHYALAVVLTEDMLIGLSENDSEEEDWVTLFQEDPVNATERFCSQELLVRLVRKCGVHIVDGAHRWYAAFTW